MTEQFKSKFTFNDKPFLEEYFLRIENKIIEKFGLSEGDARSSMNKYFSRFLKLIESSKPDSEDPGSTYWLYADVSSEWAKSVVDAVKENP